MISGDEHMARIARIKTDEVATSYHICQRTAGDKGAYPLMQEANKRRLIDLMRHYSRPFFCEISGFSVMGNHFHLVIKMEKNEERSRAELMKRAKVLYPNSDDILENWDDDQWEHFRKRLFNLSEYMSNVKAAFTKWHNKKHDRLGSFWNERFKSAILLGNNAILECLLYIDLNPLRAGIQEIPELYKAGSLFLRHLGKDDWLMPLKQILPSLQQPDDESYLEYYRAKVYYRGSVATKKNQAILSKALLEKEVERGFKVPGMYLQKCHYFIGGLAIGSERKIKRLVKKLQNKGHTIRDAIPILHANGNHQSLKRCRDGPVTT